MISRVSSDISVPISRFEHGDAEKVFDEVAQTGIKVVMKDEEAACVLLSPQKYDELYDAVIDYELSIEAERRMRDAKDEDMVSFEQVLLENGITQEELDRADYVEIE